MCSIVGYLGLNNREHRKQVELRLSSVWERSHERGRDGRGYVAIGDTILQEKSINRHFAHTQPDIYPSLPSFGDSMVVIGNMRAEPTTEYVKDKSKEDQQPYFAADWYIVHNGTIANDKRLRSEDLFRVDTNIDSAAIVEMIALEKSLDPHKGDFVHFQRAIDRLIGSFAILAVNRHTPDKIYYACNYRPIWYSEHETGVYFASAREYLTGGTRKEMIEPYTMGFFSIPGSGPVTRVSSRLSDTMRNTKALVVCSGGLDSVVAAAAMKKKGYKIELLHFIYGSRAQQKEEKAVWEVARALGCDVRIMNLPIYKPEDSRLLQQDATVAGGEEGAEYAHEWVPARNLLLLSVATAYAEANGFETLVLGNNLEEAGAYPDNEPEFIKRFNDMLPFAIGDGKRLVVEMPVGNLMKHEIVALGLQVGAPMHLTWSCYRAGEYHCGKCGPCFMRRTAFKINRAKEVITYQDEE